MENIRSRLSTKYNKEINGTTVTILNMYVCSNKNTTTITSSAFKITKTPQEYTSYL